MKLYLLAIVLVLLLEPVKGLWPAPQELKRGKDVIRLAEEFDITLKGSALLENAAYLGDVSSAALTSLGERKQLTALPTVDGRRQTHPRVPYQRQLAAAGRWTRRERSVSSPILFGVCCSALSPFAPSLF